MPSTFDHGYALLVGVGRARYADWSLPVTVKDMQALRGVLTDPALCAYPANEQHVRLLHDEGATRAAILDGLKWLQERAAADPEATVVVFYSGHGSVQGAERYYLISHDTSPMRIADTALLATAFTAALRAIKARRLLVVVDSCHAQGMATSKKATPVELPAGFTSGALPKGLIAELKQGEGRAVFTSSRGEQESWVRPDDALSIYTDHLIEALQGASNKSGDTVVRLSNLMNHLGKAVPESARRDCHAEQTPWFDTAAEDFPVALLRGGKGLPAGGWAAVRQEPAAPAGQTVQAIGERSVAIGGRATGNVIVTGDGSSGQAMNADHGSTIRDARQTIKTAKEKKRK